MLRRIVVLSTLLTPSMGFVRLPAASRGMVTYKHAEKETGHQTGSVGASTSMPTLSPAEEKMVTAFREHQQGAARLTNAVALCFAPLCQANIVSADVACA